MVPASCQVLQIRLQFFMLMGCCRHGHGPGPITLRPDTSRLARPFDVDRGWLLFRGHCACESVSESVR
jgi:hypothetical protein